MSLLPIPESDKPPRPKSPMTELSLFMKGVKMEACDGEKSNTPQIGKSTDEKEGFTAVNFPNETKRFLSLSAELPTTIQKPHPFRRAMSACGSLEPQNHFEFNSSKEIKKVVFCNLKFLSCASELEKKRIEEKENVATQELQFRPNLNITDDKDSKKKIKNSRLQKKRNSVSEPPSLAVSGPSLSFPPPIGRKVRSNSLFSPCSLGIPLAPHTSERVLLPVTKNSIDLKFVSAETVAKLVNNEISLNYMIIDCRFEYEFNGGHIKDAINIKTEEAIEEKFFNEILPESKQMAIIFHCEFSSCRGPKLYRHLRKTDRRVNSTSYPQLHYPEIYVMEDGYKAFYHSFPELCDPQAYIPMEDPRFKEELRQNKSLITSSNVPSLKRSWSTGCIRSEKRRSLSFDSQLTK